MKASDYVLTIHDNLRRKYDAGTFNIKGLVNETCAALLNLRAMLGGEIDDPIVSPAARPRLSFNVNAVGEHAVNLAASAFGVPVEWILTGKRTKHVAHSRHMAILMIHEACPGVTLRELGQCVGGLDHSTILYAMSKARWRMKMTPGFAGTFDECMTALRAAINQPAQEQVAA